MSDSPHQNIGIQSIQQLQRQLMERVNESLRQEAFSTDGRTFTIVGRRGSKPLIQMPFKFSP